MGPWGYIDPTEQAHQLFIKSTSQITEKYVAIKLEWAGPSKIPSLPLCLKVHTGNWPEATGLHSQQKPTWGFAKNAMAPDENSPIWHDCQIHPW